MRSSITLAALLMLFTSTAFAGGFPPPFDDGGGTAEAEANSSSSSNATGVGVGIGKGGNASSYSGVKNNNANIGVNEQGQHQGQGQEQGQLQGQGQKQGQTNVGLGSGNKTETSTDVSFSQNYEAADAPAFAPSMFGGVSDATCFVNIGVSGGWVGAAFGLNGWKEDYQCTVRANSVSLRGAGWSGEFIRNYQMKYMRGVGELAEDMQDDGKVVAMPLEETNDPTASWDDEPVVAQAETATTETFRATGNKFNPYGL